MRTINSREFNQDVAAAKRDAKHGPVFITDRGKPSYVLLSIEDYQTLSSSHTSVSDVFSQLPESTNDDINFPRAMTGSSKAAKLDDAD